MRELAVHAEYDPWPDPPPRKPEASWVVRIVRATGAFAREFLRSAVRRW